VCHLTLPIQKDVFRGMSPATLAQICSSLTAVVIGTIFSVSRASDFEIPKRIRQ
jgi:hypothetical protein